MTFSTLGKKLKKARLAKKLRFQDVYRHTKIQVPYIKRMESGDFSFFPEAVIRGFLKAYAGEIGLSPEEILADYEQAKQRALAEKADSGSPETAVPASKKRSPRPEPASASPPVGSSAKETGEAEPRKRPSHRWTEAVLGILLVGIVGGIIYVYVQYGKEYFSRPEKPARKISVFEARKERLLQEKQKKPPVQPLRLPEKVRLKVVAAETTWVRLITDGRDTSEFLFVPGTRRLFEASRRLELKAGRADGLILWVNQDSVGKLGSAAEIVDRLVVTPQGIVEKKVRRPRPVRKKAPPAPPDSL